MNREWRTELERDEPPAGDPLAEEPASSVTTTPVTNPTSPFARKRTFVSSKRCGKAGWGRAGGRNKQETRRALSRRPPLLAAQFCLKGLLRAIHIGAVAGRIDEGIFAGRMGERFALGAKTEELAVRTQENVAGERV